MQEIPGLARARPEPSELSCPALGRMEVRHVPWHRLPRSAGARQGKGKPGSSPDRLTPEWYPPCPSCDLTEDHRRDRGSLPHRANPPHAVPKWCVVPNFTPGGPESEVQKKVRLPSNRFLVVPK